MNLAIFDLTLLAIVAFFALRSMRHGMLYELAVIASWTTAAFLSYYSYSYLSPFIEQTIIPLLSDREITLSQTHILSLSDSLALFLIFLVSGIIISLFLKSTVQSITSRFPRFGFYERILGGIFFGIIKAVALVSVLVFAYQDIISPTFNLDVEPPFIVDSFSFYYIEEVIIFVQSMVI